MPRYSLVRLMASVLAMACLAASVAAAQAIGLVGHAEPLARVSELALGVALGVFFMVVAEFLLSHGIREGPRYLLLHMSVMSSLERQLIDAGVYIDRGIWFEVPSISLVFEDDLSRGTLKIRNSLKFENRLDDVVLSCALGKFIVERHYTTDDENHYVYELVDTSTPFKLMFGSFDDFKKHNEKVPTYSIFLDERSVVPLTHALVVGATGSGKSYFCYSLILQMLNKSVPFNLYFVDPKGSSIKVVGDVVAPNRTAVTLEETVSLLEHFVESMRSRKGEVAELLKTRLDCDYSDFGLSPSVMLFDEYASFASLLASQDKKTRDHVKALLSEVVLQGRQLGFFLIIAMQKSDSTLIETYLRDNLLLKVCLGNAEQTTITTCFGPGVEIPPRFMGIGEGFYTAAGVANEPRLMMASKLDFDILGAITACAPVM